MGVRKDVVVVWDELGTGYAGLLSGLCIDSVINFKW